MNNYQQLLNSLSELKLSQISLKLDDYITKVNAVKICIVDKLVNHSSIINILVNSYRTVSLLCKISTSAT